MNIEDEYIKNVEELPSSPHVAFEVLMIAQDEECDFQALADKINRDLNLTANMLRMANSVIYGYMKKISSVKDMPRQSVCLMFCIVFIPTPGSAR